jgi:hypothetical protein
LIWNLLSLNCISCLTSTTEMRCVYRAVRAEHLYVCIIYVTFSNKMPSSPIT